MASVKVYTGRKEMASLCLDWTVAEIKEKMNASKPGENIHHYVNVGETNWTFALYANGDKDETEGNISIFCGPENKTTTLAKVSFTLKDGKLPEEKTFTYNFNETDSSWGWGYDKFIPHSDIYANEKNYLRNGDLDLVIKITVYYGDKKTTVKTEVGQKLDSVKMLEKSNLGADFKECWLSDEFSDVKIKCGLNIFHCHRIVLARRSNYFRTILKGSFKESESGVINLENMDAETFTAVLKYIYEGELESLETNAMALLEASERFELANLKIICEEFLMANNMKLDNAIDKLMMADGYKAKKLKQAAMDMIVSNSDTVIKQEGWKEKLGRSGQLTLEIFEAIVAQKYSPNKDKRGSMNLSIANSAVSAAVEKANSMGKLFCVAVLDSGVNLVAFNRMDGAMIGSIDVAMKKARTSALFNMESGELGTRTQPGQDLYGLEHSNGGLITFPGGVPLRNAGGEMIGSIGVSGGTVAEDLIVAREAAKAIL